MNKILKFFITGLIGFAILFISFFVSSSPKVHSMLGIKSPKITSKDLKKPVSGYAKSKSEENVFSSSVDGYAHGSENKTEDSNSTTQDTTTEQDPDDGSSGNSDNNSNIKNSSDTQKTEQSSNDNKSSGSKSKSDGHYYY